MLEYIYRDFSLQLSKAKCSEFLQAIAISGGSICGSYVISNAFPPESVRCWTMFLKLKFRTESDLAKFHAMGFSTDEPPKISGHTMEGRDREVL
jgi:hypothetical protein